ncbi:hypothetical protein MAA8898_04692 [Maliponia aquimaris]|uniref:Uncharacterized protein n=1 Tax=Maliponia aquimaris TaxID=1673631 RepID=A0A238L7D8_9RHOB|nr:hypothetical protein MAA8898_04692 [Maliponia aquimaris]
MFSRLAAPALAILTLAAPVRSAPVAPICSCTIDPPVTLGVAPPDEGPASCLLVSDPEGAGCRLLEDSPIGSDTYRALFLALYPRVGEAIARGGGRDSANASYFIDRLSPSASDPDAADRHRRRQEGIAQAVATRVGALLGENSLPVADAFRAALLRNAERVDICRSASFFGRFPAGDGPLSLDLPPYRMEMAEGFGCYSAMFGGSLTLAVLHEGQLYRYVVTIRWPDGD